MHFGRAFQIGKDAFLRNEIIIIRRKSRSYLCEKIMKRRRVDLQTAFGRIYLFISVLSMAVIFLLVTAGTTPRVRYIFVSEKAIHDHRGTADSTVPSNGQLTRKYVPDEINQRRRSFQNHITDSGKSPVRHKTVTKREIEGSENWNKKTKAVKFKDLPQEVATVAESTSSEQFPPYLDPDRFKFIYRREGISKNVAKINFIAEKVRWRHSLDSQNVCNSTDPFILAIVVSSVANLQRREYIRRTWGNPRLYPYTQIRCVFIVGLTTDNDLQEAIDGEHDRYSDVIQYNYIDLYETMTYKSVALMTWAASHCPQAPFIAKIDDDVMMDPFVVSDYFKAALKNPPDVRNGLAKSDEGPSQYSRDRATFYVYGRYRRAVPLRYTKWGVSWFEYPEDVFPLYTSGPAYVFGREALKIMVEYIPYVPYLKLEDVFTTGLLSHAAQIDLVDVGNMVEYAEASDSEFNKRQIILMQTEAKSRREAWEGVLQRAPVNISVLGTPWT